MTSLMVFSSVVIKMLALIMVLYALRTLFLVPDPQPRGLLNKYFLIKHKYDTLKLSLVFVAASVFVELLSIVYALSATTPTALNQTQLLISDILLLGLIIVLTRIYRFKNTFIEEIRKTKES